MFYLFFFGVFIDLCVDVAVDIYFVGSNENGISCRKPSHSNMANV